MDNELKIPEGLDEGAVNLARAIRTNESTNKYDALGDNGSSRGGYQWNHQPNGKSVTLKKGELPSRWIQDAKEVGLDPKDFSPYNQDMVAYRKIKKYKDAGNNVLDIASIWNSGSKKGYNNIATTKKYADDVYKTYLELKQKSLSSVKPLNNEIAAKE